MGCGASTDKKKVVQQEVPQPSYEAEEITRKRSLDRSSPLPPIPLQRSSVRGQSPPSTHSGVSAKRSSTNITNGVKHQTPVRSPSNRINPENDNVSLPPLADQNHQSVSHTSVRVLSRHSPPPIHRSTLVSQASVESFGHHHHHRERSPSVHGRCSKCPHCRRQKSISVASSSVPVWLTKNPGADQIRINMDNYDIEAVKDKIIAKNHHLLGSYDYQPYLTIETADGDYDPTKENYYTQPFVAKLKPRVSPLRTPFPDYELLQRHEQRLNKPYSLPLFN